MIERRVRKLKLRAPQDALVRRGAILVEDALHTASMPFAEGGRRWFVRKLNIGRIRGSQSPASIALRIEQRMRLLPAIAIPAESEGAADAPAVYFESAADPYIALAIRICRGETPVEWYWPLAVPGWTPSLDRKQAIRAILARAIETEAGPVTVALVVDALVCRTLEQPFIEALEPQDGPALLQASGWAPIQAEAPPPHPEPSAPSIPIRWTQALAAAIRQWSPTDHRTTWFAAQPLIVRRPASMLDTRLPSSAAALIRSIVAATPPPAAAPLTPKPRLISNPPPDPPAPTAADSPTPTEPARPEPAAQSIAPAARDTTIEPPPRPTSDTLSTGFAGLFFVIPILARLGMEQALAATPAWIEAHLPYAILRAIALKLKAQDDEPVLAAMPEADPNHPEVRPWIRDIRRYSRKQAQIGLYNLVRRRGRIHHSPTHIDLFFDLTGADIRIRREGLDIDPGWVPWLGKAIHFHYGDEAPTP
ncbi:MAG: hypothetical protein JSU00_13790 [Acidobacteria bacterium]|nr:hypothetical protein [Acidobacteriota bacterium]